MSHLAQGLLSKHVIEGNGPEDVAGNLTNYWMTLWKRKDTGT